MEMLQTHTVMTTADLKITPGNLKKHGCLGLTPRGGDVTGLGVAWASGFLKAPQGFCCAARVGRHGDKEFGLCTHW